VSERAVTQIQVCVELGGASVLVGTAYLSERRGIVSATFTYDDTYLALPEAYDISPDLPMSRGGRHHLVGLPGAFADSAPDRWGRNLIAKQRRADAARDGRTLPAIAEFDYLLGVSDLTRQGALRYREDADSDFMSTTTRVPKLIDLPQLLHAADAVAADTDDLAAVKVLLDAGSGSLGGARPKASVRDGERLLIAKFPHPSDGWNVMGWEMTALDLAERAGIQVPPRRLVDIAGRQALLLDRFDRVDGSRRGFISAMTLTRTTDGGSADYLELAEAIADHGGAVTADLRQLWRRIAFSLAINNTDDHLRNHGFLRTAGGWQLSPVFDVNPNPEVSAQRVTSIGFETSRGAGLDALLRHVRDFALTRAGAERILTEVLQASASWRQVAAGHRAGEYERFAPVFDGLARAD
jgi:serine/threonine-protein kinase HipA